jgi:hypothetical protein
MEITHIDKSFIQQPTLKLQLFNILHDPEATKNLVFINGFTLDNNVFLEIRHWFFFIEDRDTRSTLLKGRCHDDLYPIRALHPTKLSFGVNKPSLTRWHNRLSHPTFQIVERILRKFDLPFQHESNEDSVCGPCQQTKSHRLSYSRSTSVSNHPLELIFLSYLEACTWICW